MGSVLTMSVPRNLASTENNLNQNSNNNNNSTLDDKGETDAIAYTPVWQIYSLAGDHAMLCASYARAFDVAFLLILKI